MTVAYHRYHGLDAKIVRIFNTYGPRMRVNDGRAVPAFISQALRNEDVTVFGEGKQTRSFTYITDLVDGIIRLMLSDVDDPVNIGNPREILTGDEAKASLGGLALIDGARRADTTLQVVHAAPAGTSREFYRAIVDDDAVGVFQGKIIVEKAAQKTDGAMKSQAILLSPARR